MNYNNDDIDSDLQAEDILKKRNYARYLHELSDKEQPPGLSPLQAEMRIVRIKNELKLWENRSNDEDFTDLVGIPDGNGPDYISQIKNEYDLLVAKYQ